MLNKGSAALYLTNHSNSRDAVRNSVTKWTDRREGALPLQRISDWEDCAWFNSCGEVNVAVLGLARLCETGRWFMVVCIIRCACTCQRVR